MIDRSANFWTGLSPNTVIWAPGICLLHPCLRSSGCCSLLLSANRIERQRPVVFKKCLRNQAIALADVPRCANLCAVHWAKMHIPFRQDYHGSQSGHKSTFLCLFPEMRDHFMWIVEVTIYYKTLRV